MPRPAKPTPERFCQSCNAQMERKRINGRLEDFGAFKKMVFCDRACMAAAMKKDRCTNVSYSRSKASKQMKPACEACGAIGKLHVHHMDEDPFNNSPSNLRTLCPRCHRRSHSPNFMADGATPKHCKHCARPSVKLGLCFSHLSRLKRYGDPFAKKIRTASGWVLDRSGLPVHSRRSRPGSPPAWDACAVTGTRLCPPSPPSSSKRSSKPSKEETSLDAHP